jgi:hypothetical protein
MATSMKMAAFWDTVQCNLVRFQVLTAASMMFRVVFSSETSVDNHFTRQYNPEDNSEQCNLVAVE